MWARASHGPSERLIQSAFKRDLDDQADLFEAMSLVDLAHTLVMMEAGIVPPEPGQAPLGALLKLHERPGDFTLDPSKGDLYTNREAWSHADRCEYLVGRRPGATRGDHAQGNVRHAG